MFELLKNTSFSGRQRRPQGYSSICCSGLCLLFCLDKLSFRLLRKLTSISSQQTMGRHPLELIAIGDYVQTLRAVSLIASRSHDKKLRHFSALVNQSIEQF